MGAYNGHIVYVFALCFLSISIIVLVIFLIFLCRKKPVASEVICSNNHYVKTSLKNYPLSEINSITDWFNPRKIIGKGRLGTTYVAELNQADSVAVKRIHSWLVLSKPGLGFQSMIRSLSQAQHPHIVPIIGFSVAPGERIIVTPFVSTMSLEFYLHQNVDGPSLLDWPKRVHIAIGVARGLDYLHEKMAPQVVHGCVKPSNILLDAMFSAQLCDYGLSFLGSKQEKVGVDGYVDDEGGESCCSKESDVYGFGVVVLEILSGRRNEEGLLVRWALPLIKEMRFSEFLDPRVPMPSNLRPIAKLSKVALACVGNSRKTRPTISQIASILENLDTNFCL